ncbi:MAG: hypothetical protein ACE5H1_11895 [Thermodesulfobacteriota bacterium]
MYFCKKCNQIFSTKLKEHGKAKTRQHCPEYFPCDGEIAPIELLKGRGERTKIQILFDIKSR